MRFKEFYLTEGKPAKNRKKKKQFIKSNSISSIKNIEMIHSELDNHLQKVPDTASDYMIDEPEYPREGDTFMRDELNDSLTDITLEVKYLLTDVHKFFEEWFDKEDANKLYDKKGNIDMKEFITMLENVLSDINSDGESTVDYITGIGRDDGRRGMVSVGLSYNTVIGLEINPKKKIKVKKVKVGGGSDVVITVPYRTFISYMTISDIDPNYDFSPPF